MTNGLMKNAKIKERNWETYPTKNLSLCLHHGESIKQYRNTLRKKKEQHVRNQLNVIEESIESNHFWENWKTLNKQHEELSIQNGDVWVNHFSNLFGSITKNKQQKHIHDQIHILESTIEDYKNPLDSRTHWIPEPTGFQNTLDSRTHWILQLHWMNYRTK